MIDKFEWWAIIDYYLHAILPAQYIFFAAAFIFVLLLFGKQKRLASRLINLFLAVSFAWNSTIFFLYFGRGITGETYGNYFFSVVFMVIAIFYLINFNKQISVYELNTPASRIGPLALLLLYPIIGFLSHQDILLTSYVGTMPCPTTAFALLLLVFAKKKPHPVALVLMLMWAIPFTPFLQIGRYGVYEDLLLFSSGVIFFIHWISTTRHKKRTAADRDDLFLAAG